jgi:hypothetical protein
VPGITSGGEGAQPAGSRPHREIVIGAMALIVVLASLAAWMLFKPAGPDTAARASATQVGLNVSTHWRVETIDGGFRLIRTFGSANSAPTYVYSFDFVETSSVSAPADASTWNPKIVGATAYAQGEPPLQILINAGKHSWIATISVSAILKGDQGMRDAWYDLENSISFTSGA